MHSSALVSLETYKNKHAKNTRNKFTGSSGVQSRATKIIEELGGLVKLNMSPINYGDRTHSMALHQVLNKKLTKNY